MADTEQTDVTALTVQLLTAYLSNNSVAHTDLADLVRSTKAALIEEKAPAPVEADASVVIPAVSVRKSLASPDHILSLIDGKAYKTLKRHLSTHGLTPGSYRERFGLPASYPMVAPGFAAQRREIAERIGLGRRSGGAADSAVAAPVSVAQPVAEPVEVVAPSKSTAKKPAAPRNSKAAFTGKPKVAKVTTGAEKAGESEAVSVLSSDVETVVPKKPVATKKPAVPKKAASAAPAASIVTAKAPKATKSGSAFVPIPADGAVDAPGKTSAQVAPTTDAKVSAEPAPARPAAKAPAKSAGKAKALAPASGSAPTTDAPPRKAKAGRDKLTLFREVAEQSRVRDEAKKAPAKAATKAKVAPPAEKAPAEQVALEATVPATPDS